MVEFVAIRMYIYTYINSGTVRHKKNRMGPDHVRSIVLPLKSGSRAVGHLG